MESLREMISDFGVKELPDWKAIVLLVGFVVLVGALVYILMFGGQKGSRGGDG